VTRLPAFLGLGSPSWVPIRTSLFDFQTRCRGVCQPVRVLLPVEEGREFIGRPVLVCETAAGREARVRGSTIRCSFNCLLLRSDQRLAVRSARRVFQNR